MASPSQSLFFDRMLERLPAGAYTCDADGLITWFNDAAVRIWGREPKLDDPVDRYCGSFRLFDPSGAPIAHEQCWMALALRDETPYEGREILIERPAGERLHVLANASPIYDDGGRLVGAVNILVDVSQQKRAEEALRSSERELGDFFENASVGLHWVDGDGIVVRVNQAELDLLGYSREEIVGHHVADFHADEDRVADLLRRLSQGETVRGFDARLRHKNGSVRDVRIDSNALFENGKLVHTRCFTLDVTKEKKAERLLRVADQRKNEFLAILAHELRNPLAPIRNAVELLRLKGPPDPMLQETRDLIDRQVAQMSRLVDDLLDLARITRGKLTMRPERVQLDAVLKSAIETARPLIEERGHHLTVDLPADSVPLDADPIRLAQVFLNLLTNSARYSQAGSRIEVSAAVAEAAQGRRVRVSVRDHGRGISREELGRVFEMFVQGHDQESDGRNAGLGIGLTLVKALVELHRGRVSALSAGPGQGSEFTVELPVAEGSVADAMEPASGPEAPRHSRRVLVVDDNDDGATSLALLVQCYGHEVQVARSGERALELAEEFRPDTVLLDIGLPGIDGYETCKRLRQQPWAARTLLVAITGWGEEAHKRNAREAGFDHHMTKPVSPPALRELLAGSKEGV